MVSLRRAKVRRKGRIIAANKAYLPHFVGNLVVDKRAVIGAARYSAGR